MKPEAGGGWTPFPNGLLDTRMPALRDTEWRVLCVVVRQTLGWKEGKGRRRRDWLSHSQLKRRTGRAGEAVSRAVDNLVRQGLLEVRDEKGHLLLTKEKRRRSMGRLSYALKERVWTSSLESGGRNAKKTNK